MISPVFLVRDGGLMTTVQDLGRFGYLAEGVGTSGAVDPFSLQAANLLAGNGREAPALEMTLRGPELEVLRATTVALCGADLGAELDGMPISLWKPVVLPAGSTLRFGRRTNGARAYLAIRGGIDVPVVLGSRSTTIRGRLGGFKGRALAAGDELCAREADVSADAFALSPAAVPSFDDPAEIRLMRGPHWHFFRPEEIAPLFHSEYTLSARSDRMGCRLEGTPIVRTNGPSEIISEPMPIGGVQIPPDGRPIVLMADRQTIGGYPLAGVVISADIPRIAQVAPGGRVRFRTVDLSEAQAAWAEQERLLTIIEGATRGR